MKDPDKPGSVFTVELVCKGKVISQNNLYFLPFKDLKLPRPEITFTAERTAEGYKLLLKTSKLAKNIFLNIDAADCTFSDNYFDMLPGTEREITIFSKKAIENLEGEISILTLDKTMK